MQLKRTSIVVRFNRNIITTRSGWLSNWTQWFNSSDANWITHLGVTKKTKPKRNVEEDRFELVKLAREMETQLFSDDTIKIFKKNKWKLPLGFTVNNVTKLAVNKNEPEEICISGYGDVTLFKEWLNANEYKYTVQNTY